MNKDNLFVAACYADQGPTLKRVMPRAQGRAFRITVIFAWALTVLYGIAHFIYLKLSGNFLLTSLSVEIICGIGGFGIIAFGEFNKWSETKDEMWEYEKNKYCN